jgi:hypothetical protein
MMQTQRAGAWDGVVVFPLLGGTVAARGEQTMQDGEEDGPFDGELKAAVAQQTLQDMVDRACFPEPLKDQGGTHPRTPGGDALAPSLRTEDGQLLGEPSQRLHQGIQSTVG